MCSLRVGDNFPEEEELMLRPEGWVQVNKVKGKGWERTCHTGKTACARPQARKLQGVFTELKDDP